MSFDFDAINNALGSHTVAKEEALRTFAETMDPNNSADLLSFQFRLQEWQISNNLQSSTVKAIKDAMSQIVQNV